MAIEFMDGKSGAVLSVRVEFIPSENPPQLRIYTLENKEMLATWLLSDVLFEDSHSVTDSRIHLRHRKIEGAMVTANRSELPPEIEETLHKSNPLLLFINSRRQMLLPLALFAAVIAALGYFSLPWVSSRIAKKIPISWERTASDAVLGKLYSENQVKKGPAADAINKILLRLVPPPGSIGSEYEYRVLLIDSSVVNAFAVPGGLILLHCGLIHQADSPDEVAGVLAHEMQHVISRHVTAGVVRMLTLSGAWKMTLGDFSSVLAIDPDTLLSFVALKYRRADEVEADQGALRLLKRAEISPLGAGQFFTKLAKEEKLSGAAMRILVKMAGTHPGHPERARLFSANEATSSQREVLNPSEWKNLKDACDPAHTSTEKPHAK